MGQPLRDHLAYDSAEESRCGRCPEYRGVDPAGWLDRLMACSPE